MIVEYTPKGVCSKHIRIDISEDGVINEVTFTGGCNGNTTGVSALIKGMKAEEAVKRLAGINCNGKGTSCPDQLSKAIAQALAQA